VSSTLLSICVATYNRERFLDEFLGRIAAFTRVNYEVVISDNASRDGTGQVVEKWRPRLKALSYVRQMKTHTAPENVCAACNAARGDYIFSISDDDMPIEDGLIAATRLLDRDPSCAAVYGSWQICDFTFETIRHRHGYGAKPTRVSARQALAMFQQYWSVELPVFRRALFQRYLMAYAPELPLDFHAAGRFLSHGDLMFIPDLVAKVRNHDEQDSRELYGPRMLQAYLTDYELFLGEIPGLDTGAVANGFLNKCVMTYLSAVERATSHGKFLEASRMMRKAKAYRIAAVERQSIAFEKEHLPAVVAEYVFQLCQLNPTIRRIVLEQSVGGIGYGPEIARHLVDKIDLALVSKFELIDLPPDEADLVIAQDAATMALRLETPGANPAKHRCLDDIVDACSLF
jgi:glycosyltransferase involved in cell wall biosynthesis